MNRGGGFAVHSRCLSPCVDYVGYAQCPCERDSSGTASRAGSPESEISLLARNGLVDRDFDVRCPPRVPTAVASIADRLLPVRVLHVIRVRRGLLAFRAAGQSTGHGVLWGKREYCPIRRDEDIGELTYTINVWTAPRPQRSAAATKSTNEGATSVMIFISPCWRTEGVLAHGGRGTSWPIEAKTHSRLHESMASGVRRGRLSGTHSA